MSLIPLDVADLQRLLATRAPTAQQYASYWGRSTRERYDRLLESAIVSFLGTTFSYFMSFVLGSFVATIFGTLFLFWGVLSPELKAYQRNWELIGGRTLVDPPDFYIDEYDDDNDRRFRRGLYGALFVGRLGRVVVVEDAKSMEEYSLDEFEDYNMDNDELEKITGDPYLLRVQCVDATGRTLQVHARMSPEYLDLQSNMLVICVLLSASPSFTSLAALTDLYVPDADVWIGDYPYLDRAELPLLLEEDDQVYNALLSEQKLAKTDNDALMDEYDEPANDEMSKGNSAPNNAYDDNDDEDSNADFVLAQRPKRRRNI